MSVLHASTQVPTMPVTLGQNPGTTKRRLIVDKISNRHLYLIADVKSNNETRYNFSMTMDFANTCTNDTFCTLMNYTEDNGVYSHIKTNFRYEGSSLAMGMTMVFAHTSTNEGFCNTLITKRKLESYQYMTTSSRYENSYYKNKTYFCDLNMYA